MKLHAIKVLIFCGVFLLFIANCKDTQTTVRNQKGSTFKVSGDEARQLMQGWRPSEYLENDFDDQGEIVIDRMTGLMWQKSGSDYLLTHEEAQSYIKKLNGQRFAGYEDWRLPTIEELTSLLEPEKQTLYINPPFDAAQAQCWSADTLSKGPALIVSFNYGQVDWCNLKLSCGYVRAVRADLSHDQEAEIHPPVRFALSLGRFRPTK